MLKADFHIHTRYSMDCNTELEAIIERCLETGINCISISDHDTVEGALKMQELAPFPVIVAEEVLTPHGEIMGMFLTERVPSGISVEQAISQIKAQDGLVCLPHPFDSFRGLKLDSDTVDRLAEQVDVVEVFNARSHFRRCSKKAQEYAEKHSFPGIAGSDAHSTQEIGNTYVDMPEFNGKDGFLEALLQGTIVRNSSGIWVHLKSTWARLKKSF